MNLYLVQHAEAKMELEDPQRGLTEKGRSDIERVAWFAESAGVAVSSIFHSAKTRAKETAEVLLRHLKPEKGVKETDGLSPADDPLVWAGRVADMDEDTMLVGHLPHLSGLASTLLTGDRNRKVVDFRMGSIVCLRRDKEGAWSIGWMVTPEMIK